MYFTKVELHNYGIYKGTHEMILTNKIGNRNITLVGGLNGRGKTTFHDAILLALYGKQALKYINEKTRSYDKLLLDHINKHAKNEETYIAVSLCLDDETKLRIKRSWSAIGKKVTQKTTVEKNGVVDKYLGESWNYYIEEILPFGIARFFFFNNEKITQLADDTSFEQIKSSIKSAIGVSAIEKAIEHTDEVIRRKKSALQAFEHSEINVGYQEVDNQINDIDRRLARATEVANDLELRCENAAAALEVAEKEFWASGGDLSRNREAIKKEMQKISDEVESILAEILQLAIDASTPLFMCKHLVIQSYNKEIDMQQSEAKRYSEKVILQLQRQILDRLGETNLDQTSLALVKNIVNEILVSHISPNATESNNQNMSATSMMLYKKIISNVFQTISQRIESLINHVNAQESEWMSLDAHLGAADEKTLAMQLFEALKNVEREKAIADNEYQRQLDSIESLKRQREILVKRRVQLIKQIAEKENANDDNARIVKYAAMSMEVLTEFKIRLQKEKVSKLSETATNCFKQLVQKDSLVSAINIDPKTLDVTILDFDGNELLKHQLSAGEQQMFAISIVWALALTSGYKAPVIIDTPMARLDSSNRANFVTKYLPAASSQVMVLSTDEEVYGRYLDLVRDNVVDYYTLLYREEEQCTSIVHGYFGEV
ncbi:MAG: DNA sulfur modification protein DndD [Acutalibacteraceae bacterium]|nr:DNA sulfur modification protein DndD [Acutalibacteraceae bacterium]